MMWKGQGCMRDLNREIYIRLSLADISEEVIFQLSRWPPILMSSLRKGQEGRD